MHRKHKGSKFEYEEQRNNNLMRVYREVMATTAYTTKQTEVFKMVAMHEAERFWVSEERALIVVTKMSKAYDATLRNMYPLKRKMYKEIYRRVKELMGRKPKMTRMDAVSEVVSSPAPEFYLTPGSTKVIISRIKKIWYLQRKHRLRHLY